QDPHHAHPRLRHARSAAGRRRLARRPGDPWHRGGRAMSQTGGEKSEKATPERMKKARKDGSLGKSQDLSAWVVVGTGVLTLPMVITRGSDAAAGHVLGLREVIASPEPALAMAALGDGLLNAALAVAPLLAV